MARQNFLGFVVSQGKMDKTIKVRVLQRKFDKKVQKEFLKKKDYLVHDEANICREGDLVRIEATRPLSARKFFAVAEMKKNKGQQFATYQKEAKLQVLKEENEKTIQFLEKRKLYDQNVDESLYNDLSKIETLKNKKGYTSDELKDIKELKEKYGINSWSNADENNLFASSLQFLSKKIENLSLDLKLSDALQKIWEEQEGPIYKSICEKMAINEETKKNIRKNLIRKYLKTAPFEELVKLGVKL